MVTVQHDRHVARRDADVRFAGLAGGGAALIALSGVAAIVSLVFRYRRAQMAEQAQLKERLEKAVADVIREGKHVTYDMKPTRSDPTAVGTSEVADAIIEKLGVRV